MGARVRGTESWLDRVASRTWRPAEVWLAAALLVVASLALRAWVVVPAFFFLDDYVYLADARSGPSGLAWLLAPYNGHLMPAARALIWWVDGQGPADWGAAATTSLALQAAASVAFAWMLVRFFGARPAVLLPLALFLTTAITVPALVWWAAAINLAGVQAALFCALGCWVEVMRGGRLRWLLGTLAAVALGLAFDVRGVLALPVLAAVSVAYFTTGGPRQRLRTLLRDHLVPLLTLAGVGGAYTAYYLVAVEGVTTWPQPGDAAVLLAVALGATLPLGAVGGPWRWTPGAPPTALADTAVVPVLIAWLVLGVGVVWLARRRTRTLRGWAVAVAYAAVLVLLVAGTRSAAGTAAAREYRFLVESGGLLALALALALLPVPGAPGSSAPRAHPAVAAPRRTTALLAVAAVAVGGVVSTVGYARSWHDDNASAPYVDRLAADLEALGPVDVAETRVPRRVLDPLVFPRNNTRTLLEALDSPAGLTTASTELHVVADDGSVRRAAVAPTTVSSPGPVPGCGWQVRPGAPVRVPLEQPVADGPTWMRVAFLAGEGVQVQVDAGGTVVREPLRPGLGSLFMLHGGGFDGVEVSVADGSADLCVDRVEVGGLVAGAEP